MFYLIGTKQQRERFKKENPIPYFDISEVDGDVEHLYDKDIKQRACLIANLFDFDILMSERPFRVELFDSDGEPISWTEFASYFEALDYYQANE